MEMDNLLILVSVFLLIHGVHVTKGITTCKHFVVFFFPQIFSEFHCTIKE